MGADAVRLRADHRQLLRSIRPALGDPAPNLWWLVVGRIIGGITSASATAHFAYMADVTTPERRARAFGLVGAAISAGFVLGPALGGPLGDINPRLPFWVAAGFSGAAFLYGLIVLTESLPPERRKPSPGVPRTRLPPCVCSRRAQAWVRFRAASSC